jgi:AcrR family transcriptional regulator
MPSALAAKKSLKKASVALARPRVASGVQLGEESARAMVLHGAGQVFRERGVRMATVEDILTAAGVSRRTFYRLYDGKEEVMVALYQIGTERLLEACRNAVSKERDPLRQLEQCIDAHLRTAREQGRLVFVLGGEAQRRESLLHARRIEVHQILTELLAAGARDESRVALDPLLFRAVVLALEGVTRLVLEEGDEGRSVSDASIERARSVMRRIATATLVAHGPGIPPLPTLA